MWRGFARFVPCTIGNFYKVCEGVFARACTPSLAGAVGLHRAELASKPGRHNKILKETHAFHAGRDLLEQLEPFPADAVFVSGEPGGVAARLRQTLDEPGTDRIGDLHENDRHGAGRL